MVVPFAQAVTRPDRPAGWPQWDVHRAHEALGIESHLNGSTQLMLHHAADEVRAEPDVLGLGDRRTVTFGPLETETAVVTATPGHVHLALGRGQRAVFRRVGGQFVQGHAHRQRCSRGEGDRFALSANEIASTALVGLQREAHNLRK